MTFWIKIGGHSLHCIMHFNFPHPGRPFFCFALDPFFMRFLTSNIMTTRLSSSMYGITRPFLESLLLYSHKNRMLLVPIVSAVHLRQCIRCCIAVCCIRASVASGFLPPTILVSTSHSRVSPLHGSSNHSSCLVASLGWSTFISLAITM